MVGFNTMPDLNQSNPLVLNYLKQNAIWWIEYADLDGFRVDTYNYSDPTGIASWTKAITDEYPNFNIGAKSGCKAKHKWRIGKRQ
jgi:glycosidase